MSFILQHQNLVANKLALFYRFDEKEKKEQVIEQFKIFAGFVDAEYFSTSLKIDKIRKEIALLEKKQEFEEKALKSYEESISTLLQHYRSITNKDLLGITAASFIMSAPQKVKDEIRAVSIEMIEADSSSGETKYIKRYRDLLAQRNMLHANIRQIQLVIQDCEDTIRYIESYKQELDSASFMKKAIIDYSICPFCKQHTHMIESEVKRISQAINNLNEKIKKAPLLGDEMYFKKGEAEEELKCLQEELLKVNNEINGLKKIIEELRKNRSLDEQGYKKMLELEGLLDAVISIHNSGLDCQINNKKAVLREIETSFKEKYNIKKKMDSASESLNTYLEFYRKNLSFESSLDEYKLRFNLDSFELYFEKGEDRIRLRQIGSGRNWLNAHLCLFLSMSHFFVTSARTTIPSLLFIDQPSQVYFPTKDNYDRFSAEKMWEQKEGGEVKTPDQKRMLNQDLEEVTNIFNTLYKFSKSFDDKVQIIVTEHADHLHLEEVDFERLVVARWRKENEGLIMDREEIVGYD